CSSDLAPAGPLPGADDPPQAIITQQPIQANACRDMFAHPLRFCTELRLSVLPADRVDGTVNGRTRCNLASFKEGARMVRNPRSGRTQGAPAARRMRPRKTLRNKSRSVTQ